MISFGRHTFAFLAGSFLLAGCLQTTRTATETRPAGARLTTAEAVQIAQQAAEKDGQHLGDFNQPEAHYEFTRKDRSWFVFFGGKELLPGNFFSVTVDDRIGKAEVHEGM
jgi:hypothetical protein